MNIISKNSKTGYSVNFPIEQTCDKSCPFYQNKTCYGLKGRFLFKGVREANESRYNLYKHYPDEYFAMLRAELLKLSNAGVTHIRINGIGDTPDQQWVGLFLKIAAMFPDMQFWVATRKKALWEYKYPAQFPKNVTVRYSDGVEGDLTSNVTTDVETVTCPATLKGSGVHDCATCGHLCWSKRMLNVTYAKH